MSHFVHALTFILQIKSIDYISISITSPNIMLNLDVIFHHYAPTSLHYAFVKSLANTFFDGASICSTIICRFIDLSILIDMIR